jgi:prevent-host-death family protein
MITNLRDAKSNLSQLVQLAADGEEIVITVRGRPTARLTSVAPKRTQDHQREAWASELQAAAEAARDGPSKATPQPFWDALREQRALSMANAIYWDTSALLKLYAPEPDSGDYLRLLIQQPEDLAICFLHRVELYFALRGKESRGGDSDWFVAATFRTV